MEGRGDPGRRIECTEAQMLKRSGHIKGEFFCELFRGGSQEMKLEKLIKARY